ncbi:M57 family metalloprotease [Yeosuana sp. AK3]
MKTMKQLFILITLIFIFSCSNEQEENSGFIFEESHLLENYQIPEEDVTSLQKLGFIGSSGVAMERTDNVNNLTYIYYLMEGDIEIRKDSLKSMTNEHSKSSLEQKSQQYRTTNLVNTPQSIHVIGINIYQDNLKQGLIRAIENYNNLNINLNFTLEFRTVRTISQALAAQNDSDIAAFQSGGDPGGVSGFPSGGNPYTTASVSGATASFGIDVCEHVFTHEIGHTIGLRHTDFFNRSISCGTAGNEGDAGVGAIHIPGTPQTANIDMNSIMLSCFDSFESGEFSNFDIIALESIY